MPNADYHKRMSEDAEMQLRSICQTQRATIDKQLGLIFSLEARVRELEAELAAVPEAVVTPMRARGAR